MSPQAELNPMCDQTSYSIYSQKTEEKSPWGELTPPILTGVTFRGKLTSNELYMHVFTRPEVTYCSASAFSWSFSSLQTFCYELLKSHNCFLKILFRVKCNHDWKLISAYKKKKKMLRKLYSFISLFF